MENFIKEAKNNLLFDKTDTSHFLENAVCMMVSLISYNITNFIRKMTLPEKARGQKIQTVRLHFIKVARKLTHTGRQMKLKFSTYHVCQDDFFYILRQA